MTAVLADETKAAILNSIPLSRAGKPEDVANAAVFLAKNNYITGQVLNVDGGMIMRVYIMVQGSKYLLTPTSYNGK